MIQNFIIILFASVITVIFTRACYGSIRDYVLVPWKKAKKWNEKAGLMFTCFIVLGILVYILTLIWLGTYKLLEM
jgi:hypothetical protein